MLGALLFNHADFWVPFTHSRDSKLDWIRVQLPVIEQDYRRYLAARQSDGFPVIIIMPQDKPGPPALPGRLVQEIAHNQGLGSFPLKVFRVEVSR